MLDGAAAAAYTVDMPVIFKSQATGDLLMLDKHAEALLRLLGKTASAPGTLTVAEMPQALVALRAIPDPRETPLPATDAADNTADIEDAHAAPEFSFQDEPVSLHQRSVPLVRLIEQALAEGKPIVWGV